MIGAASRLAIGIAVGFILAAPRPAFAQRELHWDRLVVDARLDAEGRLHVTETQGMVFTGDWNGGERVFNIRPQQKLSAVRISRLDGTAVRYMAENSGLNRVDDYAWTDERTLRWRSRLPTDPPFAHTPITYVLEYELSGILLKNDDGYVLDHDFAFPNRPGAIDRFELHLSLDPVWQPQTQVREVYTAFGLEPGKRFVLTIPMRYTGAGAPITREGLSARIIDIAAALVLGVTAVLIAAFFVRETRYGRFEPVTTDGVDEAWIAANIVNHPAEVVGAAWDDGIGTPEVVALIARLVSEGTLESDVKNESAGAATLKLRLKGDRKKLEGYERSLIEGLFFNGRVETSTDAVKAHYTGIGFDPVATIREELETRVRQLLDAPDTSNRPGIFGLLLLGLWTALLWFSWSRTEISGAFAWLVGLGSLLVAGIVRGYALSFRAHMHWGRRAAVFCLVPAMALAAAVAAYLWLRVAPGLVDVSPALLVAFVILPIWLTYNSIRGLKSRPTPAAIAFRKKLTAGREYFRNQLARPEPALRDAWYPWVLAFGLGPQADQWSAERKDEPVERHRTRETRSSSYSSSSSSDSSTTQWTGFGGGRSGGAGGGASWSSAAAGIATPIAAPKSSSSGSSSSGGGSSSSSGSSGGGGGGGW